MEIMTQSCTYDTKDRHKKKCSGSRAGWLCRSRFSINVVWQRRTWERFCYWTSYTHGIGGLEKWKFKARVAPGWGPPASTPKCPMPINMHAPTGTCWGQLVPLATQKRFSAPYKTKFWVPYKIFEFWAPYNFFFFVPYKISFWIPCKKWVLRIPYKTSFWMPYKKLDFEYLTKAPVFVAPNTSTLQNPADYQCLTKVQKSMMPYKTSFAIPYKNQVPPSLTKPEFPMPYKKEVFNSLQKKPASYLPKILTACGLEFL